MGRRSLLDISRIEETLDDAWLNLPEGYNSSTIYNPLDNVPEGYNDEPHIYFLWILTNPEYFALFCKEILNITILPFQCVILQEMWFRKFPILIGSRGLGKSFLLALYSVLRMVFMPGRKIVMTGAGFRQSKVIFEYMEKIWYGAPLLRDIVGSQGGEDRNGPHHGTDMWRFVINESQTVALPIGCLDGNTLITTKDGIKRLKSLNDNVEVWGNEVFRESSHLYKNGESPAIQVKTQRGFQYTGTPNHKMKVCRNEEIQWIRTDEIIPGDRILIDRTERWHNGDTDATVEDAYTLGLMTGDGSWTNQYFLRYTTIDEELRNSIQHIGDFTDQNDGLHYQCNGKELRQEWLNFWGLEKAYSYQKVIPQKILDSSKEKMTAFIQGLFDTDGSVSNIKSKGYYTTVVSFSNTSKDIVETLQYLLLHYGIISTISSRTRKSARSDNMCKKTYELYINGRDVMLFKERINFRLSRKKDLLDSAIANRKRNISVSDNYPVYNFCRSNHKSIIKDKKNLSFGKLSLLLKKDLPVNIKEICKKEIYYDTVLSIDRVENVETFDIHVPEGNEYCAAGFFSHNSGEKIRGQRAHDIMVDEFAVGDPDVFEHVISGFAAVSANPILNVRKIAKQQLAATMRVTIDEDEEDDYQANQIILSGTAYYSFNHFHKYWRRWQAIINSRGDKRKLLEYGIDDDNLNWKDYSVIRIPYYLIPKGFMEDAIISRSKSSMHSALFNMEFMAVFGDDSNGFFKRAMIEKCVDQHVIHLTGDKKKEYVISVDPASESDNFCVVVLEVEKHIRRVVYCWTTTKKLYKEEVKQGKAQEDDFYDYAARKILNLVNTFNVIGIAIDSQGGGHAIIDRLHSSKVVKKENGEQPLWKFIDKDKPIDDDAEDGRHFIEAVSFADAEYTGAANHGMRLDFETKCLLFPRFDSLTFAELDLSIANEIKNSDLMEEAILEIEELKNELSSIIMTQTPSGRDKWDTPDEKLAGAKKGRMRKDRYSALLMANSLAKKLMEEKKGPEYGAFGGFAGHTKSEEAPKVMFTGSVLAKKLDALYRDDFF